MVPRMSRLVIAPIPASLWLALCVGCSNVALLEVKPDVVAAGGIVEVFGAGFDPSLTLSLEGEGGTITLAVTPGDANKASATLPAQTPAGRYDVVATTSAGTARLEAALTVQAGQLEIVFVDVGQGDGSFVIFPDGSTLLFDGGPRDAKDVVRGVIDEHGGRVDAVAISHTDADHLGGMVGVLRGADGRAGTDDDLVPTSRWIGHDDAVCDSQLCDEYRTLRGVPFELPDNGTVVDHGGATVTVVARDGVVAGAALADIDEENERSLALLFEFGGRSVFIGGDLTGGGLGTTDLEAAVAAVTGPVDVLRLNHHGSETSSSGGFLDALQPRAVIISVGTDNAFCHPDRRVVERLSGQAANVYATGDGIVDAIDRCDLTTWPAGSRHGLGTFSLIVAADGAITLAGAPL